jgi:hypothetical protein
MSISQQYNIGSKIKAVLATSSLSLAQTSGAAVSTQDGQTIDRTLLARRYYSCKVIGAFGYVASATARTASLTVGLQHSSDGTSWDNHTTGATVTFGNSTAGTTDYKTAETSVNLNGARRYVRMTITAPTYSDCSSGQGVFSGQGVIVFGGGDELVAS